MAQPQEMELNVSEHPWSETQVSMRSEKKEQTRGLQLASIN